MKLTPEIIKTHIEQLIIARIPTQDKAHEEFNKGVKFATDYVLEFINIRYKPSKWRLFLKRLGW